MDVGQGALPLSFGPCLSFAEPAYSQRSATVYHRWHLNYPILILILGILLVVWAITYMNATTSTFSISDLWQQALSIRVPVNETRLELAPGVYVPREYYLQEKTYREPDSVVVIAPGFVAPQGYYVQEKTYRLPAVVTLAPGVNVPQEYYIQEKTYREPVFVEVSPGFKVPLGYYIQEKEYREPASDEVSLGLQALQAYNSKEKMYRDLAVR
jgi:hypothetical protein